MNAQQPLPLIGVTMGDGAGIGPEVIVPAVLDTATLSRCRPVVIGDAARLREAARILGTDCEIVSVPTPAAAESAPRLGARRSCDSPPPPVWPASRSCHGTSA